MDMTKMKPFKDTAPLVDALCALTQNYDKGFFKNLINYNLCVAASMMRASVNFPGRGKIPVNFYGISLAPSGFAKGYSTNIIEQQMMGEFISCFKDQTFNELAEVRMAVLASQRAANKGTDPDDELAKLTTDFNNSGEILTQFDEATVPAVKQARRKLQIANAGSLNFIVDEIGANLIKSTDVLTAFLELYDVGRIKEKLVKNTAENTRGEQLEGTTPANMMLFGTPSKLMDGAINEKTYNGFLEMGYARRSFFFYADRHSIKPLSVEERLKLIKDTAQNSVLVDASKKLMLLADPSLHGTSLDMTDEALHLLLTYQKHCEDTANGLPEHQDTAKAEMIHRYFKCVKLAGAFAFFDNSVKIQTKHIEGAIVDTEDSGESFKRMNNRERDYVRLAKYLGSTTVQATHVDISEDLAFYPSGNKGRRDELVNLAMAWAHKNGIVIKKHFVDSIEMFSGSMLVPTDLDKLVLSHGVGLANGYTNELAPWSKIENILVMDNYNWVNHHLIDGHRSDDDVIQGFNMLVLDVDGGTPLNTAQAILTDFEYVTCTTKSHTAASNRYRILLPLSHSLDMDKEEYGQFMNNIYDWLPIILDMDTKDRCRKWATNKDGITHRNTGKLLDALTFIPKTKKNEQMKEHNKSLGNLDKVERWFISNTGDGNRNNNLLKYALMLVDGGRDLLEIQIAVAELNGKMADSLSDDELSSTIMKSVSKHYKNKDK